MPHIARIVLLFVLFDSINAFSTVGYPKGICMNACGKTEHNDPMVCRKCAANPPIGTQMCKYACDSFWSSDLNTICQKCVERVKLTAPMCIRACDRTEHKQYREICLRCQENPPLTGMMCIHACDRTAYPEFVSICRACSMDPPPALCQYACRNTDDIKYRKICDKKVCS